MYSSGDLKIRNRIAAAKQALEQGRLHEAHLAMQQVEREAPRHPLVLNEVGLRLVKSGKYAEACALYEQVVKRETSNPEVWFNYAAALRVSGRVDEALAVLDRLLVIDPVNLSGLLEKGALEELKGRPRAAAKSYLTVLHALPAGFRPPQWMEAALQRAREAVEANNRALEAYVEERLEDTKERFSDVPLHRFDQCLETLLYKRRIYRQQPTFMYFPELPTIEFYERSHFPWLDSLEAATQDICAELAGVLSGEANCLEPYVREPGNAWRELNNSRRWSAYHFWREGKPFADHIAHCPHTVAAIMSCPRWDVPGSGPNAMFSVLDAKTRIPPHTGPVNTRLVVHLALTVPPRCGFRVGGRQREWQPGRAFVFDDSIDHEAWNDSSEPRAVLIFDIWSPFLNAAERALVGALTAHVSEYYDAPGDEAPSRRLEAASTGSQIS